MISSYYDQIADDYDEITSNRGKWVAPIIINEYINNLIHVTPKVLDIGIGTGKSIEYIYNSKRFSEIHGIDVSSNMLRICNAKFSKVILYHGELLEVIEKLSPPFDLILSCGTIEYIENIDNFFESVNGLLLEGGYFIFTFEPIIECYVPQTTQKSHFLENSGNDYIYRYHVHEIFSKLKENHFYIESQKEFMAYIKNQKDDIKIINHVIKAVKRQH